MLNPAFGEVVPPEFQVTETVNGPTICQSKREVGETGVHFSAGKPINFFHYPTKTIPAPLRLKIPICRCW